MNNYSVLQRFLHRFALSSQFMREVMFDVEESVFLKKDDNFVDNHVFVSGLARSGTTVLLNAIYQSNQFASLSYDDMPFILAPNFWEKFNPTKKHNEEKERAHGDGIKVTTNSPEAFEEVFWKTFARNSINREEYFKNFITLILKKKHKTRYLSKNNQNIKRLGQLNEIFPQSKILIPFRDPMQQAFSLFSQHKKFVKEQKEDPFVRDYMSMIGHSEFGLDYDPIYSGNLQFGDAMDFNHWLEQWYLTYRSVLKLSTKQKEFYLIGYESLCINSNVWGSIKNLLEIEQGIEFSFRETTKNIDDVFDQNLYDKCYELYESLIDRSFGT